MKRISTLKHIDVDIKHVDVIVFYTRDGKVVSAQTTSRYKSKSALNFLRELVSSNYKVPKRKLRCTLYKENFINTCTIEKWKKTMQEAEDWVKEELKLGHKLTPLDKKTIIKL